jgi:predicted outer membrane repeat protein
VSDVLVAGQVDTGSPIQLNGNTATLSGGALLFNLRFAIDPNVSPGTTPIRIPNDGPLPAIFEFKQGAQFPPIPITGLIDGSITITSVPDPSSMSLVAIATITMLSAFWFRQFYSHTISTG